MKYLSSPPSFSSGYQRGFTLVELVVTVALVAILTSLAVPGFSEVLRQWRRDSATRAFISSLNLARSEAIKTSRVVVVCPSANGTSCAASNQWNSGWIVFSDDGGGTPTNAANQARDAGEQLYKREAAQGGVATITSSAGVLLLQFLPNALMISSAPTEITVTPSGATSATKVDKIRISPVGRASVVTELP